MVTPAVAGDAAVHETLKKRRVAPQMLPEPAILPIPPFEQIWPRPSCANGVGRATKGVEHARILALAAEPVQLGIEPFWISTLEIDGSADPKSPQVTGEAGPDAR
jgi:hypothetical protein